MLEKFFGLQQRGTTVRQEILAGTTTFLTMAYIIFVQPALLSKDFSGAPTGLDFGALLLATCLISALTTIFMGIYANYPIALAPGMGENFFFISVIMSLTALGFTEAWKVALGIVFISGVLFFLLTIFQIREILIRAISPSMRNGIAVGIGLFITFLGFQHGNVVVAKEGTMVGLNTHMATPQVAVFFFGLILASVLTVRRIRGAILIGILATALFALFLGEIRFEGIFGLPQINKTAFFQMDIQRALSLSCIPFILIFLFMDMFDTIGTLIGVAETGGFMKGNTLPRANRVLMVDAIGTVGGATMGTSTVTSFIESITGIAVGGRSGLTSVVVGFYFLLALFFGPIISMIGKYPPITAPALVIVGVMMMQNVKHIQWDDYSESLPAFVTMVGIPFCYSIADGLALGFICYPLIKFLSGRRCEVSWLMYVMGIVLLGYFLFIRTALR